MKKTTIATKIYKNIKVYLKKIKPKSSKNLSNRLITVIQDIVLWVILWQKCFLNTIVENTYHYKNSLKRCNKKEKDTPLWKLSQIDKLSSYLKRDLNKFINKYLSFVLSWVKSNKKKKDKTLSIKDRILNTVFVIHDTTDIQKPSAKKMEDMGKTRDWSKKKSWKWYYIEWSIVFHKNKIIPLILNCFSPNDTTYITWTTKYADHKEVCKENIKTITNHYDKKDCINLFDRWYDSYNFIKYLTQTDNKYIIRWTKSKSVIRPEYYNKIIHTCITHTERNNIFETVKNFTKSLTFLTHKRYKWFEIGRTKIYRKGVNFCKNTKDIIPANLLTIRITNNKYIKWLEEDISPFSQNKKDWKEIEKELYFYTNIDINWIDDAIFVFLSYFKRWKIETYFRYLKQIFLLEKICIIKFDKIKNLINLLPLATYFLYNKYYNLRNYEKHLTNWALEKIITRSLSKKKQQQKWQKKNFTKMMYILYIKYIKQKWLTQTIDSFSKFMRDEVWNKIIDYQLKDIIYCKKIDSS